MSKKYLVIYDVETTGLSPQYDWILQLAAIKINKSTFEIVGEWQEYIKPAGDYKINPEAEVTHGLTKEFIEANGKPLAEVGQSFIDFCEGCDMGSYNGNTFDIKFLYKDFRHSGLEFPLEGRKFIDVLLMERRIHPNKLGAVYQRYTGITMEEAGLAAHNALSDVKATATVLECQMTRNAFRFSEIEDWEENNLLTPDGSIRRANPTLVVFNNGKYKDRDIYEVMKEDVNYIQWWAKNVASAYTLNVVRKYCRERMNTKD